ncbi:hypothetical protein HUU05_24685 [candidate division KSB1 bacterium]|nr:hypothetical protein [candidate division KSB1 bacterium]
MAKANPPVDTQVKVAKIGAMQAIVVTLITVAGASLGYFLGDAGKTKASPKVQQYWLTVQSVKYSGAARIVININGNDFSYPAKQVWAGEGYTTPQEKMPLPIDAEVFHITFTALVDDPDPNFNGQYPSKLAEETIGVQQIPTGERTVSGIPSVGSQTLSPMIEIKYAID